ncbi:hypothetical protein ACEYW6_35525 [Nostoc sp. UIC 10607]|uniref:hypothetical protein n=1 Tax=Nostoc sp. UIC 10607 TaxID=3045935 RepID=UPI0039A12616
MDLLEPKNIVYTAQSKHLFYCRMLICSYVLNQGAVPLNPFNVWGYFLYELVDRDLVRRANNNIIRVADEIWVFGPIADGVLAEIKYTMQLKKPLKFFSAGSKPYDIKPIDVANLVFEPDTVVDISPNQLKEELYQYLESLEI